MTDKTVYDLYDIIVRFQVFHPDRVVVWSADDQSVYIDDEKFFSRYETTEYRLHNPIPLKEEKFIMCILDGSPYITLATDQTRKLLTD